MRYPDIQLIVPKFLLKVNDRLGDKDTSQYATVL
jgi:hypothetical protein